MKGFKRGGLLDYCNLCDAPAAVIGLYLPGEGSLEREGG